MSTLALVANAGEGSVSTFTVDGGMLRRQAVSVVGDGCSTFAIDEAHDLVHVGVKSPDPGVQTCRLDRASGSLTPVRFTASGATLTYLALTQAGDRLLATSYRDGLGVVWPLDRHGLPEAPTAQIRYPNLHSVAVTADDGYCYFVSLGADVIAGYTLDSDGGLTALPPEPAPPGSGPRHIVLSSAQDRAYVLTEFSGQVLVFHRDLDTGRLRLAGSADAFEPHAGLRHSEYGADPVSGRLIWGADIHLSADQRWLWCSERTASTIASLPVRDDGVGAATAFVHTEAQPRGFAVSADSRYVAVAGELSGQVSLYAALDDGSLSLLDRAESGANPNWIRFVSRDETLTNG